MSTTESIKRLKPIARPVPSGQQVEITANGLIITSHRPGKLGGVPDLTAIVRQHRPETPHRR
jgi:hypothetical protein